MMISAGGPSASFERTLIPSNRAIGDRLPGGRQAVGDLGRRAARFWTDSKGKGALCQVAHHAQFIQFRSAPNKNLFHNIGLSGT